ncbi:unnamed protein product [Protopolystoma xenopodis]|uniref:Uncharacterized protein n=1 Tax=Protopolystoma xenopodis TaxID=117903 RepID=A0A3S4ZNK7_9PLAT|nr:unnamed protein product [Protopolystoma xenopodis]
MSTPTSLYDFSQDSSIWRPKSNTIYNGATTNEISDSVTTSDIKSNDKGQHSTQLGNNFVNSIKKQKEEAHRQVNLGVNITSMWLSQADSTMTQADSNESNIINSHSSYNSRRHHDEPKGSGDSEGSDKAAWSGEPHDESTGNKTEKDKFS